MKRRSNYKWGDGWAAALVGGVLLIAISGCFDPFYRGTRAGGLAVPEEASYGGDVYPILLSYCSACHSSSGSASDSAFVLSSIVADDYEMVSGLTVPNAAAGQDLLSKAAATEGHGGGTILSSDSVEYQTLEVWIEQGSSND